MPVFAALLLSLCLLALPRPVHAHGGEDHGAPPAAPAVTAASSRSLGQAADGGLFQVVLAANGGHTRLFLTELDSNLPVAGATVEVETAGWRGAARPLPQPGLYELDWVAAQPQDVTLLIYAGTQYDLILIPAQSSPVMADRSLGKAAQILLGIQTQVVTAQDSADTVRVLGRVVPDPDGFGRVQSPQPARIVSDPALPFPIPGQAVRRGQTLLTLEPALTNLERSDKRSSLARLDGEIAILERDLARQEVLTSVVPAKQVEQSRIRLAQMRQERQHLSGTALARMVLTAPVDGVISDVHVVPGDVVGSDRILLEIVDPRRLRVDAVIHDLAVADRIAGGQAASRQIGDHAFALTLLGVSPRVDTADQGVHAQFAVSDPQAQRLKLGMPVDVFLSVGATRLRLAVPRQAIADQGGQPMVFVRTGPEQFQSRPVRVGRIIGPLAEITHGLTAGDRVVVQGVDQIRAAR